MGKPKVTAKPIDGRVLVIQDSPAWYLVIFWSRTSPESYASEEFQVETCQIDAVQSVISWAKESSKGRHFQIFAMIEDGTTGVLLSGFDPTQS